LACVFHCPDAVKLDEVRLNRNVREVGCEKFSGVKQFFAVMLRLGYFIAFEMGQAAVGGAVGVAHDQDTFGLVQANGHADLFEDEVLFEVVARGGQGLGSSGNDDHVSAMDALLLHELSHRGADAVIEAAEDRRVGYVWGGGRIEMEDFAHGTSI
jgi:hypothetical protein